MKGEYFILSWGICPISLRIFLCHMSPHKWGCLLYDIGVAVAFLGSGKEKLSQGAIWGGSMGYIYVVFSFTDL